jgi:hypothetical protein
VRLVGFLENSTQDDVLTSIGFVPEGNAPGGVFFDEGLTIYDTGENPAGVFTIDDSATWTITGGYSFMFYQP